MSILPKHASHGTTPSLALAHSSMTTHSYWLCRASGWKNTANRWGCPLPDLSTYNWSLLWDVGVVNSTSTKGADLPSRTQCRIIVRPKKKKEIIGPASLGDDYYRWEAVQFGIRVLIIQCSLVFVNAVWLPDYFWSSVHYLLAVLFLYKSTQWYDEWICLPCCQLLWTSQTLLSSLMFLIPAIWAWL